MKMNIDFSRTPAMGVQSMNRCAIKSVKSENIFTFPEGIPGFENIKEFIFVLNEKVKPFLFMQGMDQKQTCFVCVEAFQICPDYNVCIPDSCVEALDITSSSDVLLLSLVTVTPHTEDMTANLLSPIVVNMKNKMGTQLILEDSEYPVKFNIWNALEKMNEQDGEKAI